MTGIEVFTDIEDINQLLASTTIPKQQRAASLAMEAALLLQANLEDSVAGQTAALEKHIGRPISVEARCAVRQHHGEKYGYVLTEENEIKSPVPIYGDFAGLTVFEAKLLDPLAPEKATLEEYEYSALEVCLAIRIYGNRNSPQQFVSLNHINGYISLPWDDI